ncbi:MAG: hypothetical protein NZ920_06140 [Aigarchaeota archaeon]|nr:hypothetical protein [Aigarchaeota archaeon]MDW8092686.1 hypothetical protein [Nitrososphaerota archaeon]
MLVKQLDEKERRVVLVPESGIDLLNVYRLVSEGDLVYSETTREVKKYRADGSVDSERVQVVIGIELEKKSLDPVMRRVDLLGKIVSVKGYRADIEKKYHTIHLGINDRVTLVSRTNFWKVVRLAKASRGASESRPLLCLSVDDETASLFLIDEGGIEQVSSVSDPLDLGPKSNTVAWTKRESKGLADLLATAEELVGERGYELVLIGPSIITDEVMKRAKRCHRSLLNSLKKTVATSSGGEVGLMEAIRRGALGEDYRPLRETVILERVLKLLATEGVRVYIGIDEVRDALERGDISLVIVSEDFIWSNVDDERVKLVLDQVESGRIEAVIMTSGSESAHSLNRLHGIVGVPVSQRYRLR